MRRSDTAIFMKALRFIRAPSGSVVLSNLISISPASFKFPVQATTCLTETVGFALGEISFKSKTGSLPQRCPLLSVLI